MTEMFWWVYLASAVVALFSFYQMVRGLKIVSLYLVTILSVVFLVPSVNESIWAPAVVIVGFEMLDGHFEVMFSALMPIIYALVFSLLGLTAVLIVKKVKASQESS